MLPKPEKLFFLLMPVFSQALFTLMLCNFSALSFFTAWHKLSPKVTDCCFFFRIASKIRTFQSFSKSIFN